MGSLKREDWLTPGSMPGSGFSQEEYFAWWQVRGRTQVKELLDLCPWPEDVTLERLQKLIEAETLHVESHTEIAHRTPAPTPKTSPSTSSVPTELNPEIEKILKEDERAQPPIDLDREFCREILERMFLSENLNAYQVLQISPRANGAELKQHYLKLSKKFHPDRFFRKNLGPYKARLESSFARIQKAYAILKSPIEREALNRVISLHEKKAQPPSTDPTKNEKRPPPKLSPEMEKIGRAEHTYRQGLEAEKQADYIAAYNSYLLAQSLNPEKEIYQKALDTVRVEMLKQKAQRLFDTAFTVYRNDGASLELLTQVDEILKYDSRFTLAQLLCSGLIADLQVQNRYRDAKEMMLRVKASLPTDTEPCYILAKIYLCMDDVKAAKKELKEALERNPHHKKSQNLLDSLTG